MNIKRKQTATRPRRRQSRLRRVAGFTLIEAALATVIIGTGVLAILAAQQAYHRKNDWAARTGTAVHLANEMRELMITLPAHDPIFPNNPGPEPGETSIANYDDLDDFAGPISGGAHTGLTFSPPVNAMRTTIADLTNWTQQVQVVNVLPTNISSVFTQPLNSTNTMRVTVSVFYNNPNDADDPMLVTQLTWITQD